jgi:LmbE family N-acetylglucosaminyl deacetylase
MEASASAAVLGCAASVWDYPDGYLTPSIPVRESIIREIREFQPDLVLTHRPWDYHPDHRAVGQAIQDASYMVMVPKIVPGTPVPQREPVVAYMADLFTKPLPFQPDFILDATPYLDGVVHMLAQHTSQFGEWLPWIEKIVVPHAVGSGEWVSWLKSWFLEKAQPRRDRFWQNHWGHPPLLVEAFEISEYAGRLSPQQIQLLFPNCHQSPASSLPTKS